MQLPLPLTGFDLEFVRHPRARRYLLRLIDERTIRVTLPRWGSKKEAVAFVERERPWIDKQRRRFETERARRALDRHAPVPAADTPIAPDAEPFCTVAPEIDTLAPASGI